MDLKRNCEIYKQPSQFMPELDFCSDSFNAVKALNSHSVKLPNPKAKTYNNLAEYYSHTFLKIDKKTDSEKDRPYDRDYSWYYSTLGLDERAQKMYEQRTIGRKKKYAGWRTAKMRKYMTKFTRDPNRELCRGYEPLKSSKVIRIKSVFSKYKIILKDGRPNQDSETNIEKHMIEMVDSGKSTTDRNLLTANLKE